eukprot:gene37966-45714_t
MAISQFTPTTYYYIDEDNFILDWLIAVSAMSAPPLVMSVSWELPDHLISATHLTAVNNQAMILSAMGVTLIAASGDNGAHDNTGSCKYSTDFPASSPYFTAVGATDGPEYGGKEVACQSNLNEAQITSGGGISTLTASTPYWQVNQVNGYFSNVDQQLVTGYSTI